MATVVFIHGIGVRTSSEKDPFMDMFEFISDKLRKHARRPDLNIIPFFWGDQLGAKLHAKGLSIPQYDTARGFESAGDEDYEISLWQLLYQDPLYELRLLSLRSRETTDFVYGKVSPVDQLDQQLRGMVVSGTLQTKLDEAGFSEAFPEARLMLLNSSTYYEALQAAPQELSEYRAAIARALVAQMIALHVQQRPAAILLDARLRDEVVILLIQELGDTDRSISSEVAKLIVANPLTLYLRRWRGKRMDSIYPFAGDVLLYQARGEPIRDCVRKLIEQAAKQAPPVVLLAHSLGGIASVDLLIQQESVREQVKFLVTVGSQAPFLYEIGALCSLPFDGQIPAERRLPANFPKWLNIYDLNDFLSYIGAPIFPNRVQDVLVNNRQPFPYAHSAYWKNDETWQAIVHHEAWKEIIPGKVSDDI